MHASLPSVPADARPLIDPTPALPQVVLPVLKDIEAKQSKAALGDFSSAITSTTLEYVAALCSTLIRVKDFDLPDWQKVRARMRCRCRCRVRLPCDAGPLQRALQACC